MFHKVPTLESRMLFMKNDTSLSIKQKIFYTTFFFFYSQRNKIRFYIYAFILFETFYDVYIVHCLNDANEHKTNMVYFSKNLFHRTQPLIKKK